MDSTGCSTRFSLTHLELSFTSRLRLYLLRWLLRPLLAFVLKGRSRRIAKAQVAIARMSTKADHCGLFEYGYHSGSEAVVAGHSLGRPLEGAGEIVVLWLHGGTFIMPAMPDGHLVFAKRLCDSLSASAFLPDYRLAPANPFPAALDDCEAAYRLLVESGVSADRIIIGGESAGGNLLVSLLYRIRSSGMPLPACAVAVSPALDLSRLHGPPSRQTNAKLDAMLPIASLATALDAYLAGADAGSPEISPLLGDCTGLPPILLMASDCEILRDDSVLFAHRLASAGTVVELALWPRLPHAFPLLEDWFPEASKARHQISTFIKEHMSPRDTASGESP